MLHLRARFILVTALLSFAATTGFAGTIGFSGTFPADDFVQIFHFSVQNLGPVTISTTSYNPGFEPILSLFDSTGTFQFLNDGNANSPAGDAVLTWNSLAGENYIVALTEYDNYPVEQDPGAGRLSAGFTRDGQGNFTAAGPPFGLAVPGGSFLLPDGTQLTGNWSVNFSSADPTLQASSVPEPASGVLLLAGAGLLIAWKRTRAAA
jgi:hypothetical protein